MKCGPSPSRAVVDDGASTQAFLKKELPTKKRVCRSDAILAADSENALRPVSYTVVSPPSFSSPS
ncbi:hypothetical protein D3C85_1848480 [compost metagenome]